MNKIKEYTEKKKLNEKNIVSVMISIFCKYKHKRKNGLCEDCQKILNYSYRRIENCPYIKSKTFCSSCKTHCYRNDMREKIKEIMRFSGPKMIFYNPIAAIKHMISIIKIKLQNI